MRVGEFAFDTLLYEGAQTLVYGGVRQGDRAPVVVKLTRSHRRNLAHEHHVLEKLAGPGIVEGLGLFDGSDGPVLVQRRFGNGSLADALRGGRFPVARALAIAAQLARVCGRVHAARIVHRDIKPANILYDPDTGEIALGDFGIAAELPVNARALPVGDLVGTPAYVSPEHTGRTTSGCDPRSDLYSLGVTLYELFTGGLPFPADNLLEVVAAHLSKLPEPPHRRVPGLPVAISDIVMKLLAKSPDARYQSARGLAADLERCLATLSPDGRIAAFELGCSDVLRARFPERLFGREAEMHALAEAFARASTGAPTLVMISGREGSGRSELVRALIRDVASTSSLAIGGWAALSERPLAGLCEAIDGLVGDLLRLDEDQLAVLRQQFAERMGQVGQLVLEISPAMVDVFGEQPELAELNPGPARARLQHGFRCFVSALGDIFPFVLALRGFEHADRASAGLVEAVLNSQLSCRTLIVLIGNEPAAFGALRSRPNAVSIELGPLPIEAVCECVQATLDCPPDAAAELGRELHSKAGGNALMFVRLLEDLIDTGVVERRDGRYTWSLDAVRAAPAPPTLGALASQRIAELDHAARSVLAAAACSDEPLDAAALAAALAIEPAAASSRVVALVQEGLVAGADGHYRAAHPVIAETALAAIAPDELAALRRRLAAHLLAIAVPEPSGPAALGVAMALSRSHLVLGDAERLRAAELYVIAAEYTSASTSYEVSAELFRAAQALLGDDPWCEHRQLEFRIALGHARTLMLRGRSADADAEFRAISTRNLEPEEIGVTYGSWSDNRAAMMDRAGALEIGIAGLARLGITVPAEPSQRKALAAIRLNQRYLSKLTLEDHLERPVATDPRAVAAMRILPTMTSPAVFSRRMNLYVLIAEIGVGLVLRYGHMRNMQSWLALHSCFLHAMHGNYAGAKEIYKVCLGIEKYRPAPELAARTVVVFNYMVAPWFESWRDCAARLSEGIRIGVETGDSVFAALSASASITLLSLIGAPLDRVCAAVEGWAPFLRGDGGVAANAANVINITGKLSRGELLVQDDFDRITNVPMAAGPMRNNAMVNLGFSIAVAGYERQVRAWFDEIRDGFPQVNFAHPHAMTLWLLDALFAAKDARAAGDPERARDRRAIVERSLERFRMLRRETGATNNDPAIALLEAELARIDRDFDRAAALYGRAARESRAKDLTPLVGYTMEQRADMLHELGYHDEALLFYREALLAYRRWANATKVALLEQAHPALRARELGREPRRAPARIIKPHQVSGPMPSAVFSTTAPIATFSAASAGTVSTTIGTVSGGGPSFNDQLDLVTVLKVSQDISTQLTGSGVVRAVLSGIAQNAGAERVVLVLRDDRGSETVYGELRGTAYRDLGVALDDYAALPRSVVRVVRRTSRPLVVSDASSDAGYSSDPYVVEHRARSIAGVPIRRKGEVTGFVILENRMVSGAFTPQLVSLTQALVAQAAISLDNASLYKNLEDRVDERTAALNQRNAEMRMVLDHVAQGLLIVDTHGRLFAERSAILATWFPAGVPETLAGFFADEPGTAAWLELAWAQLIEGAMPLDLLLYQLPKQLALGGRVLAFDWQPIFGGNATLERVLVVLSDVTEAMRRIEVESEQMQLMAVFERMTDDRNGVVEFLKESAATVGELASGANTAEVEKRLVHTLKGNAAVFGLPALAALCHELEDAMEIDARGLAPAERDRLTRAWKTLHDKVSRFIDVGESMVQVRKVDVEAVLSALRRDGHPVAAEVELWSLESMRMRFQRIADQARALADQLGKAPLRVDVQHAGVYLERDRFAPFWSAFVHVVRNAIDHGIEEPAERALLGKPAGTLTLQSYLRGGVLVIELSDDGAGIAWDKLRDKARAAGLASETRRDLVAALFLDGISTRDQATEISGRGVGLGALAQACRELGCEIVVESQPGQGTTMRFELPGALARVRRERPHTRDLIAAPARWQADTTQGT